MLSVKMYHRTRGYMLLCQKPSLLPCNYAVPVGHMQLRLPLRACTLHLTLHLSIGTGIAPKADRLCAAFVSYFCKTALPQVSCVAV